jgi:rhamnose transport system substrate-binding protein
MKGRILSSMPTATNQNAWIDSMKKSIANDSKFAKLKLDQVAYGQQSAQINQQLLLFRRPGLHIPKHGL